MRSIALILVLALIGLSFTKCSQTNNNSGAAKGDGTNGNITNVISNPKDDLVGEFAFKEGGKAILKVTKEGSDYFISNHKNERWSQPEMLSNVNDSAFMKLFGKDWRIFVKAGMNVKMFGIFKLEKGYKLENTTFKTGYFGITFLGGGDLYKL